MSAMTDGPDRCASQGRAGHLRRAVELHEHIKEVIRIASRVNLIAINANLVARSAGQRSRGFRVVSAELRSFSNRLEAFMSELGIEVNALVKSIARMLKECRYRRVMGQAHERDSRKLLADTTARMDREIETLLEQAFGSWSTLNSVAQQASKLCRRGVVLSRNAKIEAATAGDATARLSHVADEIESAVSQMQTILRDVLRQTREKQD